MPEIKPCPFCGDEGELVSRLLNDRRYWAAGCIDEHCRGNPVDTYVAYWETKGLAIKAWNIRSGKYSDNVMQRGDTECHESK